MAATKADPQDGSQQGGGPGMKVESRLFDIVTATIFIIALLYTVLAREPVGIAALWLTGGLTFIIGTYFRFISRRLEERPEDNPYAEVSDGAGDVGFFSPGSYWPFAVAASAAMMGIGLAFFYAWVMVMAGVLLLIAIGGMVFEYHIKPSDH